MHVCVFANVELHTVHYSLSCTGGGGGSTDPMQQEKECGGGSHPSESGIVDRYEVAQTTTFTCACTFVHAHAHPPSRLHSIVSLL